jgi:LacI family transcriptional regulator
MSVTVKQIAEMAGVSRGTVDRALNGRGNVRPEVEKRILEIAAEMGYTPNRAGKALAYQRKNLSFGIIVNAEGNEFFDEVLRGAQTAVDEYADFGLTLRIAGGRGYDAEQQLAQLEEMRTAGVSGLAISPINLPAIARKIDQLIQAGVSVLTVNSDIENTGRLCYVGCNYYRSGVTAAGMLRLMRPAGVRAGIITGSIRMLGHNRRMKGFSDSLKEMPDSLVVDVAESLDETDVAYQVTRQMLEAHPEINTLYFAAAGAVGGMQAAVDLGRNDLSVISCDDTDEICELVQRGLIHATICQEPFRQGYRSMQLLFDAVVNNVKPAEEFCYMDNIIRIRENL